MRTLATILAATAVLGSLPAQITYVDAQSGGTTLGLLSGSTTAWSSTTNDDMDGLWGLRTTGPAVPANGGTAWQASHLADAPTLVTLVGGLQPGQRYSCYVYMIGKDCETWPIQAGLDPNRMHELDHEDGLGVDPNGSPAPTPPCQDFRFRIFLGHAVADASGQIPIFVDDFTTATRPSGDRVVYDGVGVEPTLRAGSLRFGNGCPGSNGSTPVFTTNGLPSLGNGSFALQIVGGPAMAPAGVVYGGSLAPSQFGACLLEVRPIASSTLTLNVAGNGSVPLGVPTDAALTGLLLHTQAVTIDAGGALLNVGALTNTVDLYLGS